MALYYIIDEGDRAKADAPPPGDHPVQSRSPSNLQSVYYNIICRLVITLHSEPYIIIMYILPSQVAIHEKVLPLYLIMKVLRIRVIMPAPVIIDRQLSVPAIMTLACVCLHVALPATCIGTYICACFT